jgi:hypothetical protein
MQYARPAQRAAAGPGGAYPPSDAQLKYGQDLAKKAGKEVPAEALTSSKAMSILIGQLLGKSDQDAGKGNAPAKKAAAGGTRKPRASGKKGERAYA